MHEVVLAGPKDGQAGSLPPGAWHNRQGPPSLGYRVPGRLTVYLEVVASVLGLGHPDQGGIVLHTVSLIQDIFI